MFTYKALNNEGEYVEGELNLSSKDLVISELLKQEYVPIQVVNIQPPKVKLSLRWQTQKFDKQTFFENLHDYLDSGLSIDKALELETKNLTENDSGSFLNDMVDAVRQGGQLSTTMESYPDIFTGLDIGLIRVGEETDSLAESLKLLSDLTFEMQDFKQKIKSALVYPAILSAVMLISVMVLFGLVIPRFKSLFIGMGIEVNGLTGFIVGLSDLLVNHYQLILVLILLFIFSTRYAFKAFRSNLVWAEHLLKIPLIGQLVQHYNLYIFSMIMQTLMHKKITILESLAYIQQALENIVYKNAIEGMVIEIRRGNALQKVLNSNLFTDHFVYLIAVGEETGRMKSAFNKLSNFYYKQLDNRIKTLMTYVEPTIIILLGLIVGLIVVSMLQAILSINELAV